MRSKLTFWVGFGVLFRLVSPDGGVIWGDFGLACLGGDSVAWINPCGLCRIGWFQPDLD